MYPLPNETEINTTTNPTTYLNKPIGIVPNKVQTIKYSTQPYPSKYKDYIPDSDGHSINYCSNLNTDYLKYNAARACYGVGKILSSDPNSEHIAAGSTQTCGSRIDILSGRHVCVISENDGGEGYHVVPANKEILSKMKVGKYNSGELVSGSHTEEICGCAMYNDPIDPSLMEGKYPTIYQTETLKCTTPTIPLGNDWPNSKPISNSKIDLWQNPPLPSPTTIEQLGIEGIGSNSSRNIVVGNLTSENIAVGIQGQKALIPPEGGGFVLPGNHYQVVNVDQQNVSTPGEWMSGRIWARNKCGYKTSSIWQYYVPKFISR